MDATDQRVPRVDTCEQTREQTAREEACSAVRQALRAQAPAPKARLAARLGAGLACAALAGALVTTALPTVAHAEESAGLAAAMAGDATAAAANVLTGDKDVSTSHQYTATGMTEAKSLRYIGLSFVNAQDSTINMNATQWFRLNGASEFDTDNANEFAGKWVLSFANSDFYSNIETITFDGTALERRSEGAVWTIPVKTAFSVGAIGASYDHDVVITLKNGQTLDGLGLGDTKIAYESVAITSDGAVAQQSLSSGFILGNQPAVDEVDSRGFTNGAVIGQVLVDTESMTIKSIHTFKPNENYLQTDYSWVVYVKEQIPQALLPYIDVQNAEIYNSDQSGNPSKNRDVFKVVVDENGLFDTSTNNQLSIKGSDTKDQLNVARDNTNEIFWGTLGQSRSYTISYKIKDGVSLTEFAKALNEYIKQNNDNLFFESWMESDYRNGTGVGGGASNYTDGGAPTKRLKNSYTNAYLSTEDSDGDGVFDFLEWQTGTDAANPDTDGDGVPDGQELYDDNTDAMDAKDYLVQKPTTTTTSLEPGKKATIEGAVPKPLIADPGDASKMLAVTSQDAAPVRVELFRTDNDGKPTGNALATTTIAFADLEKGAFSLDLPAGALTDADNGKNVVIVATDPKGDHTVASDLIPVRTHLTADDYDPTAAEEVVPVGGAYDLTDNIVNRDDLPKDITVADTTQADVIDVNTVGSYTGQLTVKYADNSTDVVDVPVRVVSHVDYYTPQAKDFSVDYGAPTPDAAQGIGNTADLPKGTTYAWKQGTEPDTSKSGDHKATVVVTYPDTTSEEVEVTVHVNDSQAQTNNPQAIEQRKPLGTKVVAADSISNKDQLPANTKYAWETEPDNTKEGTQTAHVVVTYPDGSSENVPVNVSFYEVPTGQDITVNVGDPVDPKAGIKDIDNYSSRITYTFETPVDTTKVGDFPATILAAQPDGVNVDKITITVHVVDPNAGKTDADKNDPAGQDITVGLNATPDANAGIANLDDLTNVKSVAFEKAPDTSQEGTFPANVIVTYNDKSTDTVPIKLIVKDSRTDAEKYPVKVKEEVVELGGTYDLRDNVTNGDTFPGNWTVVDSSVPRAVDVNTPGTYTGAITVTFEDGTWTEVNVPVRVVDSRTDAQKTPATPQDVTTELGQLPDASEGVANKDDLPQGTGITWSKEPDVSKPGETTGTIKVTYPDTSTQEFEVKVTVVDPNAGKTNADEYEPTVEEERVELGGAYDLTDNVTNLGDLPAGTTVKDVTPAGTVDVNTPGSYTGTIEVTYPDGTKDTATVPVNVVDSRTDAAKYTPTVEGENVDLGGTYDLTDNVTNLGDLPAGTTVTDITPAGAIDVNTAGSYTGTIKVTYPDTSSVEVSVPVNVVDSRTDAEKTPAKGQDVDTDMGKLPDASEGIANKGELPGGTDISWSKEPDVSQPGTSTGTITVTFPDGSKQQIDVNVNVTDPRTDADKYDPKPGDQDVDQGKTPNPGDSIANKDELPDGTDYEWKGDAPDTSKPGDQTGTVVVKYPDGSTDEVEVTVHVKKPTDDGNGGNAGSGNNAGNAGNGNTASSHSTATATVTTGSKHKGTLPKTGDDSLFAILASLFGGVGATVVGYLAIMKRRHDDARR